MSELLTLLILTVLVLVVVAIVRAVAIGVRKLLGSEPAMIAGPAPAEPDTLFAPHPSQPLLTAGWMEPPIVVPPSKPGRKRVKVGAPDAIIAGEGIRYGSVCFLTGMPMLTCDCPECAQWRKTHAHPHA